MKTSLVALALIALTAAGDAAVRGQGDAGRPAYLDPDRSPSRRAPPTSSRA